MAERFGTDFKGRAVVTHLYAKKKIDEGRPKDEISKNRDVLYQGNEKRVSVRNISARVQRELLTYEKDLEDKRKKLKSLLECEENCLLSEYRQYSAKKRITRDMKEEKERLEKLQLEESKETEEFLAEKQLQLDMSKCKAILPLLNKRREMEIRQMQQLQMLEKKEIMQNEKEVNKTWHCLMKKDLEAEKELGEKIKMEQVRKKNETRAFLDNQIQLALESQKKMLLEEKEEEKRLIEKLKEVTASELQMKSEKTLKKKLTYSEILKQQMVLKTQSEEKMVQQERAHETFFAQVSRAEISEDAKKRIAKKNQEKKELDLFAQHFAAVKAEREAQQRRDDELVTSIANRYIEESEKQRCLLEKHRRQLLQEALSGRRVQLQEKAAEAQRNNMEFAMDKQLRIEQAQQMADIINLNKQKERCAKIAYRQYLEEQMRLAKVAKEKATQRNILEFNKNMEKEQQYNEKMVALMSREFATEGVHPFMKSTRRTQNLKSPLVPETNYNKY